MWKYVLAWIPMVFLAIANGALREGWYGKHLSELQAHQVSTATGVLLFGVYIWVLIRIWRPASAGQALIIEQHPQSARQNNFPGEQLSRGFLLLSENLSVSNYPGAAQRVSLIGRPFQGGEKMTPA